MLRNMLRVGQRLRDQGRQLLGVRQQLSTPSDLKPTDGEQTIIRILKEKFPEASDIQVEDISGGCGAMYQVAVESETFRGKRTIQQHRLVTQALSTEIKEMHGIKINTKAPDQK